MSLLIGKGGVKGGVTKANVAGADIHDAGATGNR